MEPRKALYLPAAGLILSAALTTICWPTEVQGAGTTQPAPQVQQTAPQTPGIQTPGGRPGAIPSPSIKGQIQGKLSAQGGKVTLRLTRSAARVEVFSGPRKLAALRGGTTFDVTSYIPQASATGLTFHYFGSDGQKSTQVFAPAEIQSLSGKSAPRIGAADAMTTPGTVKMPDGGLRGGPEKGGSAQPASGRTLSTDPRLQSQMLSPSGPPSGVRKNITSPQQVGTTTGAAGRPVTSAALSSITITSPKQRDFMVEGGQFVLQWSGYGNIPEKCVDIDLFQGIYHVMLIAGNVCVNGYNWQLPQGVSGTGYEVRIRTLDNAFTDDSDAFSIITAQPDLRITNLHTQPATPDMNDDITIVANVVNAGHGPAGPTDVKVRLQYQDRIRERTVNTGNLSFGGHQNIGETFDSEVVWGDLTATVEVDTQGVVTEADEGNNSQQHTFDLVRLPNLVSCVREDYYTHIWTEVHIQFKVKNNSFEAAGPFVYRTYVENKGQVSHDVPGLGPFETYDIRRSVNFGTAGGRNCWGKADYTGIIEEYREDDNEESGRIHSSGLAGSYPTQYPECD
jgi:hypothetical protein